MTKTMKFSALTVFGGLLFTTAQLSAGTYFGMPNAFRQQIIPALQHDRQGGLTATEHVTETEIVESYTPTETVTDTMTATQTSTDTPTASPSVTVTLTSMDTP
ncbi:MAG: hypothetical protein ACREKE_09980, partial [bacterium]